MAWSPRHVAGGEYAGQPQPSRADDYVSPLADDPPTGPPNRVAHRRQTHFVRLAVAIAFVGTVVFVILLLAGIL